MYFLALGLIDIGEIPGGAEMSSKEAEDANRGEVIKNIHYISDDFWESKKEIKD